MILVKRDGCFCSLFVNDFLMIKGAVASVYNRGHAKEHYYIQDMLMNTNEKMTVLRSHGRVSWIIPHCHSSQCFSNHREDGYMIPLVI